MIRKQRAWVAPRPGETRRSGFKSLRPHFHSLSRGRTEEPHPIEFRSCRFAMRPFLKSVEGALAEPFASCA